MPTEVGKGIVVIEAEGSNLAKSIEKEMGGRVAKAADTAGKKAGKSFISSLDKETSAALTSFGKRGLAVTAGLTAGLFASAKAAGGLSAAISANDQVLGGSAAAVQTWAKNSVEAVGLSERAAIEAATSFGQLGKIAGEQGQGLADFSTELVELAADMAAFKDVSPEQALQDLQSGFAGSTEVLRKYGIFLDDAGLKQAYFTATGKEASSVLTAQERVIATHQAIMEKSVDMQGQWARESDGFAAQQAKLTAELENMAASIGQSVLPAFTAIVKGAAAGAKGITDLNEASDGFVGDAVAIGTVGLGIVSTLSLIAGSAQKARDRFVGLNGELTGFGKAAKTVGQVAVVLAVAEAASQSAGVGMSKDFSKTTASIDELRKQARGLSIDTSAWEYQVISGEKSLADFQAQIEKVRADTLAEDLLTSADAIAENDRESRRATGAMKNQEHQSVALSSATESVGHAQRETAGLTNAAEAAARKATDAVHAQVQAYNDLIVKQQEMVSRGREAVDAQFGFEAATDRATDAVRNLDETLADSKSTTEDVSDATRSARDAAVEASLAYVDLKGVNKDSALGVQAQIDSLTLQAATLAPDSPLRLAIEEYIAALGRIPKTISTNISSQYQGQPVIGSKDDKLHKAAGGPVKRNRPYIVGEKGPELFIPENSGQIVPNEDSAAEFLRWYSMYFTAHPDEKAAFDKAYPGDGSFPNIKPPRDFYAEDRDRIAKSYAAADAQPFAPAAPVVPTPAAYEAVLGRMYGTLLGYPDPDNPDADSGGLRSGGNQGGGLDDVVAAINHTNELLTEISGKVGNTIALDDRRVVTTLDRAAERIRKETA